MRAVLDANVLISALISKKGSPGLVIQAWLRGEFEVVASGKLIEELERVAGYKKVQVRIDGDVLKGIIALLREAGLTDDPESPPHVMSADPGDDYLIALAAASSAVIVSGDRHLLELADDIPVYSPADFLILLQSAE